MLEAAGVLETYGSRLEEDGRLELAGMLVADGSRLEKYEPLEAAGMLLLATNNPLEGSRLEK